MKTNMRDKPLIDIKLQRNCIDSERGAFALFFPKFTIWKDHRNSLFWWPDLESRECWSHLYSLTSPPVHYCSKNVLFFPSKPVLLQHLLAVDWGENRIRFPVSILQPPIFFFQNEKKMINSGLVFVLEIQHFPHHRLSVASQVQFESMLQFWVRSFSKATAQFLKRICNPYFPLECLTYVATCNKPEYGMTRKIIFLLE